MPAQTWSQMLLSSNTEESTVLIDEQFPQQLTEICAFRSGTVATGMTSCANACPDVVADVIVFKYRGEHRVDRRTISSTTHRDLRFQIGNGRHGHDFLCQCLPRRGRRCYCLQIPRRAPC